MIERLLIFTAHVGGWLFVLLFWLFLALGIYQLGLLL